MKKRLIVALIVLGVVAPAAAYADSDGYYCTGPGYLAYQFGMAPKSLPPHRVYIINLGGPESIPEPTALELPQFQVHGMVCGERWIDVASFTTVYRITLDEDLRPTRYEVHRPLDQPIPQVFIRSQLQNLGALGGGRAFVKPIRASLGARPQGGEYLIEITATSNGPEKQCEISITSRVVEFGAGGEQLSERVIFQGRGHRECGGGGQPQRPPNRPLQPTSGA